MSNEAFETDIPASLSRLTQFAEQTRELYADYITHDAIMQEVGFIREALAQAQPSGYSAADMSTAAAGGFRDGQRVAVPEGMRLVPAKVTLEMLHAAGKYSDQCAIDNYGGCADAEGLYEVMLDAVPAHPECAHVWRSAEEIPNSPITAHVAECAKCGSAPTRNALLVASAQPAEAGADELLRAGFNRSDFHDKARALYHQKTFADTLLPKLSIHAIRSIFNAIFDALPETRLADARQGAAGEWVLAHAHAGQYGWEIFRKGTHERLCGDMTEDCAKIVVDALNATPPAADERVSNAARDVLAERKRQIEQEGWTPAHDDEHDPGTLAKAGAAYALIAGENLMLETESGRDDPSPDCWPFDEEWWKPGVPRRDLVKAAAFLLAEIECIDRAALAASNGGEKS